MTITFRQGALSGGGFDQDISISNDGATRLLSYDSSNAWVWNDSTQEWDNIFSQDRIPAAYVTWGGSAPSNAKSFSTNALVVAPSDSDRVYGIIKYAGGGDAAPTMIWSSDDRCVTWVDTGYTTPNATTTPRGFGPKMAVDPANPDVVYISDNAGVIHRSFDGGETWERPTALTDLLISAVATAATASNAKVLTFAATPADVQTRNNFEVWAANISRTDGITIADTVLSTTATTVTLTVNVTGAGGVQIGDTIVFGSNACIAFDPSSGTTGGLTNTIYIGWAYGASAVYVSTDAGATWTATTGGPAKVRRITCSSDGVLYACSYLQATGFETTDAGQKNVWKYASGTWTNFTSFAGSQGNVPNSVAADPLNAGHVVAIQDAGNIRMSNNYGSSWTVGSGVNARVATDSPWLATTLENWQTQGSIIFDPVVSNRLWIAEGIGAWYCTPPFTNSAITITSQNKNQQGLIVDQILKVPSGPLMVAVQDRVALRLTWPYTTEPASDTGIMTTLGSISHGWAVDYAKDDPTFIALIVNSNVWVSDDNGETWTKLTAQVPSVNAGGAIAVQTALNMVWFPANNGTPGYTTDGGANWSSSLFAGSTLSSGWSNSLFNNRHIAVADYVDPDTYYAFNFNNNSTGGVWRSTDGGANWTNMTGGIGSLLNIASANINLIAIPGKEGHLMLSGGANFNSNKKLLRSVDGGATWVSVTNTGTCWQVAAGKALDGAAYPAIYITGTLSTDADAGIFAATDFTDNTAVMPTWTRLSRAPDGNMDTPKSLCADLDSFGWVYLGFGSTGYAYGSNGVRRFRVSLA